MEEFDISRALAENPEIFLREAARRNLLRFAQYMQPDFQTTQFHRNYYAVLDKFAHKQIKNLIIQAPPQHGKALQVDTPVLTTKGWKRHGDLQVGDYVFGDDGLPKRVEWNSGEYDWPTMSVNFEGGTRFIAAKEHEWKVYRHNGRKYVEEIVETQHIFKGNNGRAPFIKTNFPIKIRNDRHFIIKSIDDCGINKVNCIQVEGGMYLAGLELVPTHNSQGSSRHLPAFMLGNFPDTKMIICSYAATIAKDFNRDVQRLIDSDKYRGLFPEIILNGSNVVTVANNYLRNSDVFEIVNHTGSLRVVGRGGALTSKTADVMIFDDLYKDSQEANSPQIRQGAWDWYTKVARTRLHNDSQQLIVFTRWHPDDIIGKIIESEDVVVIRSWSDIDKVPFGGWALVNFEAIKMGAPTEIDPREPGEPLWPERHSLDKLEGIRAIDAVGFQCLFQGDPGSAEGKLYQPFKYWVEKADWGQYVRSGCYVDVADEGDDYLFAATYDIYKSENKIWNEHNKRFEPLLFALITDIIFTDESTEVTTVTVPRLINTNGAQKVWVESNNGGSQFEKTIKKKVRALTVPFYQGTNKESRVVTNAPFVNQHIIMPLGWESRYPKFYNHLTNFLRKFDANEHDDDADGLTGIYEKEIADGYTLPYGHARRGIRVR